MLTKQLREMERQSKVVNVKNSIMTEHILTDYIQAAYKGLYEEERIDIALSIAFNNKKFNADNIEDVLLLKEFVVYCASDQDLTKVKFKFLSQIIDILRKEVKNKK